MYSFPIEGAGTMPMKERQTIHIFLVDPLPEEPEEENVVEGSLVEITPLEPNEPPTQPDQRKRSMVILFWFLLLAVGMTLNWHLAPFLSSPTTITITPLTKTLTTIIEVEGRPLAPLTLSQTITVPTTGKGHQEARIARGMITFYNASLTTQTIPAGQLLVGTNGVEVVTDQDAIIPPGSLVSNGQVTVFAHALQTGPIGNIKAGEIYGACCRVNVFAANGDFTGGQNERSYHVVAEQDIKQAETTLKSSLLKNMEDVFKVRLAEGETLITPLSCSPHLTNNKNVGEEAEQVEVTVEQKCSGVAYEAGAIRTLLVKEAEGKLGSGYRLKGMIEISVISVQGQRIRLRGVGTWVYQFSPQQLEQMGELIAGKDEREAKQLLLSSPGVQSVSFKGRVPTDNRLIRFLLVGW